MEKEVSKLGGMAIILVAVAVVIVLGFGAMVIGKTLASKGQIDLVGGVDYATSTKTSDFDNTIVTGITVNGNVSSLINNSDYTVLVSTVALEGDGGISGPMLESIGKYKFVKVNTGTETKIFVNFGKELEENFSLSVDDSDKLLKDVDAFESVSLESGEVNLQTPRKNNLFSDISALTKDGTMEISDSDKFESYLIKDLSGSTCGIVLDQIR